MSEYKIKIIIEDGKEYKVQIYNNRIIWQLNGKYHREKGPAIIHKNGYKEWWQNGIWHRLDGPARVFPNNYKKWYKITPSGDKEHYINGEKFIKAQHDKIRTILALGMDKV